MSSVDPNITTQQMKAVLTIARCRSFVAAAEELDVSQSSLTRTIQSLEEHLQTTLFARSTRRVELTPAGEEFVSVAERVLNDLGIALQHMRDLSDQKRGQVIISTLMSVAHGLLPPIIARYRAAHPAIEVHIREGIEREIEEDLRSGTSDLAIAAVERVSDAFRAYPLIRESLRVVLPDGHELAAQDRVFLKKLVGVDLISLPVGSRTRQLVDGAAAAAGVQLRHATTASQIATIYALVREGLGVAVLPDGAAAKAAGTVSLPLARANLNRDLSVLHLAERPLTPAAQGLLDMIREALGPSG